MASIFSRDAAGDADAAAAHDASGADLCQGDYRHLRRGRYYLGRTLYGAAVLIVLVVIAQEYRWLHYGRVPLNVMSDIAAVLFTATSVMQFGAVFLFVPLFVCGAIAGEREEQTLDLLFTTHLSNREIVLGKLASRALALASLILCGLPVLAWMLMFGGVAPEGLLRVEVTTVLTLLFVGAHAIYFSVIATGTLEALVRTYWWLGVLVLGIPLLVGIAIDDAPRPIAMALGAVLLFVNPVGAFVMALDVNAYNTFAAYLGPWYFPALFIVPAAWLTLLLWHAVARLRQTPAPILLFMKRVPWLRYFWERWYGAVAAMRRRRRAPYTLGGQIMQNPIWLRARLAPVYDRTGHIGLILRAGWAFALLAFALLAIFNSNDLDDEEASMAFVGLAWAAVGLLVVVMAGSSFVGDRRRGFLELVLVTPLTSAQIVDGVFLAVWEHVRPLFWLPWVLGVLFCLTGASFFLGVLAACLTATLYCAVLLFHGLACSTAARTTPAALVATLALPAIGQGATGLLVGFFGQFHGPVLWVCVGVFVMVACIVRYRRLTVVSTCLFLVAVHLTLLVLSSWWTYDGRRDEYPVGAMQPGFLIVALLDDNPHTWFRRAGPEWIGILPCFWLALILNLWFLRSWLIRHFDQLAERSAEKYNEGTTTFSPVSEKRGGLHPAIASSVPTDHGRPVSSKRG